MASARNMTKAYADVPYINGKRDTTGGGLVAPRPKPPEKTGKSVDKSKAFNPALNGTLNINISKGSGGATKQGQQGTPGGDFTSNEDIRAYSEHGRKAARLRAVNVAMDVAALEGRLSNIPDTFGSMSGARMRARRVTRWLKRIAQAEKLIARWYSALYSAFEREYEAELMKIGKGRQQQKQPSKFGWR